MRASAEATAPAPARSGPRGSPRPPRAPLLPPTPPPSAPARRRRQALFPPRRPRRLKQSDMQPIGGGVAMRPRRREHDPRRVGGSRRKHGMLHERRPDAGVRRQQHVKFLRGDPAIAAAVIEKFVEDQPGFPRTRQNHAGQIGKRPAGRDAEIADRRSVGGGDVESPLKFRLARSDDERMAAMAAKRDLRFRRRGISTTFDPFDGALTWIESDDEALASAGTRRRMRRNRARKILEIRFRQEGPGKAARD